MLARIIASGLGRKQLYWSICEQATRHFRAGTAGHHFYARAAPLQLMSKAVLTLPTEDNARAPNKMEHFPQRYLSTKQDDKVQNDSLLLKYLPHSASPYIRLMRLDKPIGTWLLTWPCFWSIALAAEHGSLPDLQMLALFGSGAILLRGAGCTINDLWDRDLDSKVERTRSRPLAAKEITIFSSLVFLSAQLALGLGILLQLNTYSQLLGAASLPLVVTYPLMKRITFWPQAFLGLTINWGALLGWSAIQGDLNFSVTLPLYASCVAWTLVYDTIYAHQDKIDDAKVGVKSTALHFGSQNKEWLSLFAVLQGAGLLSAGYLADCHSIYYSASLLGTGSQLWNIYRINLDNPKECMDSFQMNKWYGALIFSGIIGDRLFT